MRQLTTLAAILAVSASMVAAGSAFAADETPPISAADPIALSAEEKAAKLADEQEARRKAAMAREDANKARQAAWAARCVIKPAMSDEEIAVCREVRTQPAPAVLPAGPSSSASGPFSDLLMK